MGIRKKIIVGFILIGMLLLMSGILTSLELAKLNRDTAEKIKNNEETLILSKQLLDAAQQNNSALLSSINEDFDVYDSIIASSSMDFEKTLLTLKHRNQSLGYIQRIEAAYSRYNNVLTSKSQKPTFDWFVNVYSDAYSRLSSCIKDYMMYEQDEFLKYTSVLENNMYRALMIGLIAFSASIILLLTFYFLINLFFLSPVLKMEKALREFLKANIPYSVKIESDDEINVLSSEIEELSSRCKSDID